MPWICLRCEGLLLPKVSSVCPNCNFNLEKIQHFLGNFLPVGGFQVKLRTALTELHASRLRQNEFLRKIYVEKQLALTYLERFSQLRIEPLIQALKSYHESLCLLDAENHEHEKQAVQIAHEADDFLLGLEKLQSG